MVSGVKNVVTNAELIIILRSMRYAIQTYLSPDQQEILVEELNRLNNKEVPRMLFENFEKSLDAIEEEGFKKGFKEGFKEGCREVAAEFAKEEMALAMLSDKMDMELIAKYTRLPLEKIRRLSKN